MMKDPTRRDLTRLGEKLGESGSELFRTTLYALSSSQSGDVGSERCTEFVAAQVYDQASSGEPRDAREYVMTFREVYGLESMSDVDDLLGRQQYEERGYAGQKEMLHDTTR